MNLRSLSDDQLHSSTVQAAKREREETINLLKHLSEVEHRHLFSKFTCDSLHAYCVDYLKMSHPHAGRRVSASRLLHEIPAIEEKVRIGTMNLTSVCQANTFFRKEAAAGNELRSKDKIELLTQLEGQSTRQVDQILLSHSDQPEIHLRESVKQKTASLTEVKLLIDDETFAQLKRLKEILSHEMPNATFAQIISKLAKLGLEKLDPYLKAKRAEDRKLKLEQAGQSESMSAHSSQEGQSHSIKSEYDKQSSVLNETHELTVPEQKRQRYISAPVRHAVWMRDLGCCTFVDEKTGEFCESRRFVEFDHIKPFANGGDHSLENLRLRCRTHNQRHAINAFGLHRFGVSRSRSLRS